MAYMLFDNKEEYLQHIGDMLNKCDIFTLDKIMNLVLRDVYPAAFPRHY